MIVCTKCGRDRSDDVVHDSETRGTMLLPREGCGTTTVTSTADESRTRWF
jgi:hypothetical protein